MTSPLPVIKALQKSSHQANQFRNVGNVQIPQAWVRYIPAMRSCRVGWSRMVTLAMDPVHVEPTITVTDLKQFRNGSFIYVYNETIRLHRMRLDAFLRELARVTAGCMSVPYLGVEEVARQLIEEATRESAA